MGDIGIPELLIILAIIIILFGPSRLAGLGKSLGQGIHEFRTGMHANDTPEGDVVIDHDVIHERNVVQEHKV